MWCNSSFHSRHIIFGIINKTSASRVWCLQGVPNPSSKEPEEWLESCGGWGKQPSPHDSIDIAISIMAWFTRKLRKEGVVLLTPSTLKIPVT